MGVWVRRDSHLYACGSQSRASGRASCHCLAHVLVQGLSPVPELAWWPVSAVSSWLCSSLPWSHGHIQPHTSTHTHLWLFLCILRITSGFSGPQTCTPSIHTHRATPLLPVLELAVSEFHIRAVRKCLVKVAATSIGSPGVEMRQVARQAPGLVTPIPQAIWSSKLGTAETM